MCNKNYRAQALVSGPWIDTHPVDEVVGCTVDTDLSYWTGLGQSYEPEWYPLASATPVSRKHREH